MTILVEEEISYVYDCVDREFEKEPEILDRIYGAISRALGGRASGGEATGAGGGDDRPSGEAVLPTRPEP